MQRDPFLGFHLSDFFQYVLSNHLADTDPSGLPPDSCVKCNNPYVGNGCGPKDGLLAIIKINRPAPFIYITFKNCCNDHDVCYCECGIAKADCDNAFFDCMMKACREAYKGILFRAFRLTCIASAITYKKAVQVAGGSIYKNAQNKGCANCELPIDIA